MGKAASRPAFRTSFYTSPMDDGGHDFGLGNKRISFADPCGMVRADAADGEAVSRSREGNSLAENTTPDRMLRGDRVSERSMHNRYSTSKSLDKSSGDKKGALLYVFLVQQNEFQQAGCPGGHG